MPKYKVSASKNQKKYSFVFSASSISEAKNKVHGQGYSILGVEELDEKKFIGKKIIFKATINGEKKNGKVIGNDLFKIYLKLKDGLGYDIEELYFEKDKDESLEEKKKIISKIINQYNLFHELNSKKKKLKTKSEKFNEKQGKYETHTEDFYLRKQLEENYKLLKFVLEKFQKLFKNKNFSNLDIEKTQKLKKIYNSLILLKTSTNIDKIKKISEISLLKLGEIELFLVEEKKDESASELLKETNLLLKKFGSKKQFIEKEKDLAYQIKAKIEIIFNIIKTNIKSFGKKKKIIDEQSTYYLSTILSIKNYKNKLKDNTIKILKNFYLFFLPFGKFLDKKNRLLIERRLINSNLILLKAKINKNNISYTKVKRGYNWFLDILFLFFENIRQYLFLVILFYSLLFLSILILSYYDIAGLAYLAEKINYRGIYYFLIFLFIYLAIYLSKGIWTLLINFSLVFFLIIFSLINF